MEFLETTRLAAPSSVDLGYLTTVASLDQGESGSLARGAGGEEVRIELIAQIHVAPTDLVLKMPAEKLSDVRARKHIGLGVGIARGDELIREDVVAEAAAGGALLQERAPRHGEAGGEHEQPVVESR